MKKEAKRLSPGDPVPAITLTRADGGKVSLAHQSRAGRAMVLAFGDPGALSRLEDAAVHVIAELNSGGSALYAVACGNEHAADSCQYVDPAGDLARQLTGSDHAVAVLTPNARLAATFPLEQIGEAAALAVALMRRTPERRAVMQAPILLIDQVLEPDLCAETIAYWEVGEKIANAVSRGTGLDAAVAATKRRTDVIVQDGALFSRLKDRIEHRILPEMYKAFRTRIVSMEALRIGLYDAAERGVFERHRDNTTPQTAHRGFALSLNLNEDYEGGVVRFPEYDRAVFAPPAGCALIFSCALLHEALPLTRGRRFAVFSFLNDAEGAAMESRRLRQQQGNKRSGALPGLGG